MFKIKKQTSNGMKQPRGAAGGDLIFFIFFLIVLGIVWSLTGGPDRAISIEGPFLNPPFPLGDGNAYRVPGVTIPSISGETREARENESSGSSIFNKIRSGFGEISEEKSPYAGTVFLSRGDAKNSDPNREYLILKTDNDVQGRITLSDWRLESTSSFISVAIGDAAHLPLSGQVNTETPVAVGPNTTMYLVTGRSPIGTSFRSNVCTGYFEQAQDFSPKLRLDCPLPLDELRGVAGANFVPNDACLDYVEDIRTCEFITTSVPGNVESACQNFITEKLIYNGCVQTHRNEAGFYKDEWRIYLDRDQELWKSSHERIRLLDENGLVVDAVSY